MGKLRWKLIPSSCAYRRSWGTLPVGLLGFKLVVAGTGSGSDSSSDSFFFFAAGGCCGVTLLFFLFDLGFTFTF